MDVRFTVGVLDFRCDSTKACSLSSSTPAQFCVSFGLHGDFLEAALTDSLRDTVDYDALCQKLADVLRAMSCSDPQALAACARHAVSQFSAKISGGYVTVRITCHEPFLVEQALL